MITDGCNYEPGGRESEPSIERCEITSLRIDGHPEGVRTTGPNHLSGRAILFKGLHLGVSLCFSWRSEIVALFVTGETKR